MCICRIMFLTGASNPRGGGGGVPPPSICFPLMRPCSGTQFPGFSCANNATPNRPLLPPAQRCKPHSLLIRMAKTVGSKKRSRKCGNTGPPCSEKAGLAVALGGAAQSARPRAAPNTVGGEGHGHLREGLGREPDLHLRDPHGGGHAEEEVQARELDAAHEAVRDTGGWRVRGGGQSGTGGGGGGYVT